jgi:hydrogenase maturation factor
LLIAVSGEKKEALLTELANAGVSVAAVVGQVTAKSEGEIVALP